MRSVESPVIQAIRWMKFEDGLKKENQSEVEQWSTEGRRSTAVAEGFSPWLQLRLPKVYEAEG